MTQPTEVIEIDDTDGEEGKSVIEIDSDDDDSVIVISDDEEDDASVMEMDAGRLDDIRRGHVLRVDYHGSFLSRTEATAVFAMATSALGLGLGIIGPRGGLHRSLRIGNFRGGGGCLPWDANRSTRDVHDLARRIAHFLHLDEPFEYCVAQIYKNERGYKKGMGAHIDDEQDPTHPIVGLSLFEDPNAFRPLHMVSGEHRKIQRQSHSIDLHHGSIYVLCPPTNEWWKHQLKPRVATRVSLTFRRPSGTTYTSKRPVSKMTTPSNSIKKTKVR